MICHRASCGVYGIALGADVRGHASRMGTPVIQKSRHMNDMFRPVGQTQDHIVILAAVKLCTEQFGAFQQTSLKYAEMADIIVGPQIIRRVIRLKVHGQHMVNIISFKGRFITVNIIGLPFVNHLHIFIQRFRVQNIVVVKKPYIFPRSQAQTLIGVPRNAFVPVKLPVKNPGILFCILPAYFPYIRMLRVGAVRKTQLPFSVSLIFYGINHLQQEFFRRIVKRHENTDTNRIGEDFRLFLPASFGRRKAFRTVMAHGLFFSLFIIQLCKNTPDAAAVLQAVYLAQTCMHQFPGRLACFPERIIFDAVQLKLQFITFFFQFRHPACKIRCLDLFFLISFPIIQFFFLSASLRNFQLSAAKTI